MGHWALVKLAVSVFPRGKVRDAVFRHVDRCPSCQARLVDREAARKWLVQADQLSGLDGIWPAVRKAMDMSPAPTAVAERGAAFLSAPPPSGPALRFLRWAAAAGGIVGAAALILLALSAFGPMGVDYAAGTVPPSDPLQIQSASIAGRPADAYVIEIPEDRMILVWVEPRPRKGGES